MPGVLCELPSGYFTVKKKLTDSKGSQALAGLAGRSWEGHVVPTTLVICSRLCSFSPSKPLLTGGRPRRLRRTELTAQRGPAQAYNLFEVVYAIFIIPANLGPYFGT